MENLLRAKCMIISRVWSTWGMPRHSRYSAGSTPWSLLGLTRVVFVVQFLVNCSTVLVLQLRCQTFFCSTSRRTVLETTARRLDRLDWVLLVRSTYRISNMSKRFLYILCVFECMQFMYIYKYMVCTPNTPYIRRFLQWSRARSGVSKPHHF